MKFKKRHILLLLIFLNLAAYIYDMLKYALIYNNIYPSWVKGPHLDSTAWAIYDNGGWLICTEWLIGICAVLFIIYSIIKRR